MSDLTRDELAYLRFLRRNSDVLNMFPVTIVTEEHILLEFLALRDRGYIASTTDRSKMVITQKGLDALHEAFLSEEKAQDAEQQRQKELARQQRHEQEAIHAQQAQLNQQVKKQFKHDWLIALFELVGGFVLGLVVEHFVKVLDKVSSAFAAFADFLH